MSSATSGGPGKPPLLPPRHASDAELSSSPPPAYDALDASHGSWSMRDPRASSQESLRPSRDTERGDRRTLLAIYIHGFMGNETSFRSFPAHVHRLLVVLLADTHVVHTKLYPRYLSKRNISVARDNFSKWLAPHESPQTDVILLGHSMGGLLAAEIATMPSATSSQSPLRHRILGTINFDVPFLGMDPGIIKSGLASIFRPADEPHDRMAASVETATVIQDQPFETDPALASPPRADTFWGSDQNDPNYNPSFANDVVRPVRSGWRGAWHFISKHSNDLKGATKQLVKSHLEFGGAMANYTELKLRYGKVRVLEEDDTEMRRSMFQYIHAPPRVRFVNYYTACTGRPKNTKTPDTAAKSSTGRNGDIPETLTAIGDASSPSNEQNTHLMQNPTDLPGIKSEEQGWQRATETLTVGDKRGADANYTILNGDGGSLPSNESDLPLPSAPPPLDLSYIKDPELRKLVEKEHANAVEAYEKAKSDRESALSRQADRDGSEQGLATENAKNAIAAAKVANRDLEREKARANKPCVKGEEMSHSQKEELRLDRERQRMAAEARRLRGEKEPEPEPGPESPSEAGAGPDARSEMEALSSSLRNASLSSDSGEQRSAAQSIRSTSSENSRSSKPAKERRFCTLPPEDSNGARDPCWVRVFMQDVDEVGAHCGLFFVDERYERLVGEVANKIEEWVREDVDTRLARDATM